jgi:hypothetical protein
MVEFDMGRCGVAFSVALAVVASSATVFAGERPRAVVELFTSQGCSSCPPADKLAGELASDPSLIVMSLAIDYWDYLGWKDTLALPGHANRQRAYAAVRGDREVYTPQAVVNGVTHVIGNDKGALESAIAQRPASDTLMVPVTLSLTASQLTVAIAAAGKPVNAEVWLCPISHRVSVEITRGENRGHTITYTNVVRHWVRLGDWNGTAHTFNVAAADFAGDAIDEVAVVVQSGDVKHPGVMLGAAMTPVHAAMIPVH